MHTNHRRKSRNKPPFRSRAGKTVSFCRETGDSARIGYDFTNGHRGHARDRHGAKKSVRTSLRRHNKNLARKALQEAQG